MSTQQEDLEKIWAYMVMKGTITDGNFSYYGGGFDGPYQFQSEKMDQCRKTIILEIGKHGVAWGASGVPYYMSYSEFAGTDQPSDYTDCLIGTLVLCNGKTFHLGVQDASEEYVELVARYTEIAAKPAVEDYVAAVFGKK